MDRVREQWNSREVARLLSVIEAERRYYQSIISGIPVGLVIVSTDLAVVSSNRQLRGMLGVGNKNRALQSIADCLPADVVQAVRTVLLTGQQHSLLTQLPESDRPLKIHIQQIRNWEEDARTDALLTVEYSDSSPSSVSSLAGEDPLPADEMLNTLEGIVWAVAVPSMRFVYVNEKAQDLLGYPINKWLRSDTFWSDRIHPADRSWVLEAYQKSIANWSRMNCEFRASTSHERPVWIRESARLLQDPAGQARHLIGFAVDVTRRHLFDHQFAQAQRVEATSALAQRIAAEITNQVTVISGYSEEILLAVLAFSPLAPDLRAIQTASGRLKALAAQLTPKPQPPAPPTDPVDLIALLRKSSEPSLEVEWKLFPAPIYVRLEPQAMDEILAAFIRQAKNNHAGRLKIECAPREIDEAVNPESAALPAGSYAVLTIHDDGETMGAAARNALFDFFPPGGGLVLGDAYSLIRGWGGDIAVSANIVQIYLPVAKVGPLVPGVPLIEPISEPEPPEAPPPEVCTILVAEDEPAILALIAKMLRREGYKVLEALDPDAVLLACQNNPGEIDLLIADIRLGLLHTKYPILPILYLAHQAERDMESHAWLAMPFTLGSLIQKVRELVS